MPSFQDGAQFSETNRTHGANVGSPYSFERSISDKYGERECHVLTEARPIPSQYAAANASHCRRDCDGLDLPSITELINKHRSNSAQCYNKDTVFILGNTGAGKSTTINYVCGRKVVTVRDASDDFVERLNVEDPLEGCAVGHSGDSQTRYLQSVVDPDGDAGNNLVFCDTPGFEDTEGSNVDIANAVAISCTIRQCRSVRLILLIDANMITSQRGVELNKLLHLFKRFLINTDANLDSVLPLITHCQDTSERKLISALDRFSSAAHFSETRCLLQRIRDLLQCHPHHVMLYPADARGAGLLPHVKALIYGLTPIAEPRLALRSPLGESSSAALVMRCKDLAGEMESRFRGRQGMRALKDDLDDLGLLSSALDLPDVAASYSGVCALLAEHICAACRGAREAFVQGRYLDARHCVNGIDGFESLREHYAAAYPDLRAREYVTLLTEMNQAVQGWLHEVLDAGATVESLLPRLDALLGVERSLRELLEPRLRDAYRRAVESADSRFSRAAQDAAALVAARDLGHGRLEALLDEMQSMRHFAEHLEDRRYYEECVQAIRTLLDEAHALVMQRLEERIDLAAALHLRAGLDMLGAASGLKECHTPDAQRQHAECVARLDAACNGVFALVDTALAQQTYAHAADCLGQLRLLDLRGDAALETRLKDKMSDVQTRLENEVMSIRSMLGDEIPRDQDYACAVGKVHKFAEALENLEPYLAQDVSLQFGEELHHVHSELAALHRVVVEKALRSLCLMPDADADGEVAQSTEDPRELARSLTKIEFMLSTKLDFDTGLWSNCADLKAALATRFSEKCDWCREHARSADSTAAVEQIQTELSLLKLHAEELRKLTGRGEALPRLFSADKRARGGGQHGGDQTQCSEQAMSEARTTSKQSRAQSSSAYLGLDLVRGLLNFGRGEAVGAGNASGICSTKVVESRSELRSIDSLEELARMLEAAFEQTVSNLALRTEELESMCLKLQREARFEEVCRWLALLSSFKTLEPLAQVPFTDHYRSAVSSVRSMLSEKSNAFDHAIRADAMEEALKLVDTARNMLVLKDHVPPIEEVFRRVHSVFLEKTSQFSATMNELLECKNYTTLSKLLKGHSQLEYDMPAARHEFDSAQQQLVEFFRIRFDRGWSTIQSMVPTKRLQDQKLNELAEVMKDFADAQQVFEVLREQKFMEWTELLTRTLRGKVSNIAQHGETCIRNLDIKGYDGCVCYLDSLQVVSLVAEDIGSSIIEMDSKMLQRIDGLENEVRAATERTEHRVLDKIFNGLKRGLEVNIVAGRALDKEYEHLQDVLEHDLKQLCGVIQDCLDNYEIKQAHESLDKFKRLLVSEAVKATEYNDGKLARFQSDMDEIKQEILTPRLVLEDPEKISLCLEGFKEVDSRFYKRQRNNFLDKLKAEIISCGQAVATRDTRCLKGLEQRLTELKCYERALQGQGCDKAIEGLKKELFDSLTDTVTQAHEDIDFNIARSKWDEVDSLKKFLSKAYPILQVCEVTDEAMKREFMERFEKMNLKIQDKANGLTSRLELIESFDLKNPLSISADDLNEFLMELEKEGELLGGRIVSNFSSQEVSPQKIVRDIKIRLHLVPKDLPNLWLKQEYKVIAEVLSRLQGLTKVSALAADAESILTQVQGHLMHNLDALVTTCLEIFTQALSPAATEGKDAVRSHFQKTNALLEDIQKAQKHLGGFREISLENREDKVVKVMIEATNDVFQRFLRSMSSSLGPQMEDVVSFVLNLWTVPSEVSNHKVKAHATAKINEIFVRCRDDGKRRKVEFNFGELGGRLAEADPKGGEIVEQFSEIFRAFHSMKFRDATARMTITDSLDKLAKLNDLSGESKEALRVGYTAFYKRFRSLLETNYNLDRLCASIPREDTGKVNLDSLPGHLATIFAAWSISMAAKGTDSSTWPSPHPVQVLSIFRLLGLDAPKTSKNGFLHDIISRVGDYFTPKDGKAKAGHGHLIELKTGEGKSIVLGALATLLGVLGFQVDCVCYSQYLSTRDWSAFQTIFELFGVQERVKYDTFTSLSKRLINSVCDVREGTRSFINSDSRSGAARGRGGDGRKKILLIDEVDVFFGEEFYGAIYAASSVFLNPHVEAIQRLVWQHRALPSGEIVARVKKHEAYAQLSRLCASVMPLINKHVADMAGDVKLFDSKEHQYQVDRDGRIAYATQDTISSNIVCGYKTLFAYFKEHERGSVTEANLTAAMGLHVKCGNFSYAEIPLYYDQILGVTGTLESLGDFEKEVIQSVYGITNKTLTPSIYGDSQLTFREVSDVHVEPDEAQYNRKIKEEILAAVAQERAALVFFESERRMCAWLESGYADGIENMSQVTSHTENIDHYVKQATRARSVTLFTAVHGRGLDFVCHDKAVDSNGGVHVVQCFLSAQLSEEIQIKGRTARQDKKGTFKLVLLAADLERFGVAAGELEEARRASGVYPLLHAKRSAWFATESARRAAAVECARECHARSVAFQRLLLDLNGTKASSAAEAQKIREALLEFHSRGGRSGGGGGCRLLCLSDATGSMEPLWDSSKKHIETMLVRIEELAGAGRVELKWAAYRDYDMAATGGLLQCSEWTTDAAALLTFLKGVSCEGGGDFEEAVEAALALANREEVPPTRVLLIGDAPPHFEKKGERLTSHSHVLETDWEAECGELERKGVPLYTFQVGNTAATATAFAKMAAATGGEARKLKSADDLLDVVCLQALEQVGGSELADQYRAKYMAFTFSS